MRRPSSLTLLALALSCAATALPSQAATDGTPAGATKPAASSACVDVEVNGYRSLSFDCLSTQMHPEAKNPNAQNPALASEEIARRAPNQLGLFNQAAFSNRMGGNLGRSAVPQRPPRGGNAIPAPQGIPRH